MISCMFSVPLPGARLTQVSSTIASRFDASGQKMQYRSRKDFGKILKPTSTTPLPSTSGVSVHQRCEVLNCEVEFSSLENYRRHMEDNNHSPCWPTRHLLNGVCQPKCVEYCCPICGLVFKVSFHVSRCQCTPG